MYLPTVQLPDAHLEPWCAQTVYYFKAYFAVTRNNDEKIDVAVPSGNFGNIYAGYLARRMG